jgi:hypothetical protein
MSRQRPSITIWNLKNSFGRLSRRGSMVRTGPLQPRPSSRRHRLRRTATRRSRWLLRKRTAQRGSHCRFQGSLRESAAPWQCFGAHDDEQSRYRPRPRRRNTLWPCHLFTVQLSLQAHPFCPSHEGDGGIGESALGGEGEPGWNCIFLGENGALGKALEYQWACKAFWEIDDTF